MGQTATTVMRVATKATMEGDEDKYLVSRYLAGDMIAFDELMPRHQRAVYRLCFRFVKNREDAMDMTQEVFIKAFEKLTAFRANARF